MNMSNEIKAPSGERGAALIVVLILLMVMTLLGIASLRGTLMEERMAANMYDRSLGFQAAEAAMRVAETRLLQPGTLAAFPTAADTCANGLCSQPVPAENKLERADDPNFNGWFSVPAGQLGLGDIAGTPQYFVEQMGEAPGWALCDREIPRHPNCMRPRYRITARSTGDGRANVILQTSFAGS